MQAESQELEYFVPILTAAFVVMLWRWATSGRSSVQKSKPHAMHRARARAATSSFTGLTVLALLAPYLAANFGAWVIVLAASACALLREATDPCRFGFWHHRRLRWIGSTTVVALAGLTSLHAKAPWGPVLAMAALSFHRHHLGTIRQLHQSHEELDALSAKVQALTASLSLLRASTLAPAHNVAVASVKPVTAILTSVPLTREQPNHSEPLLHAADDKLVKEG